MGRLCVLEINVESTAALLSIDDDVVLVVVNGLTLTLDHHVRVVLVQKGSFKCLCLVLTWVETEVHQRFRDTVEQVLCFTARTLGVRFRLGLLLAVKEGVLVYPLILRSLLLP